MTQDGADFVYVTVTSVGDCNEGAVIFPNPANDKLVVRAEGINEVMVYDLLGQCVYRYHGSAETLEINTTGLNAGVYTVNVTTSEGVKSRRIVVIH